MADSWVYASDKGIVAREMVSAVSDAVLACRLECLKLAQVPANMEAAEDTVKRARVYEAFVLGLPALSSAADS